MFRRCHGPVSSPDIKSSVKSLNKSLKNFNQGITGVLLYYFSHLIDRIDPSLRNLRFINKLTSSFKTNIIYR